MRQLRKVSVIALCVLLSLTPVTAFAADYTVTPNDSLYKISLLFKTPISTLKQENSLSADTIYPGQVLYVSAKIHTVISGDSLYTIAKQYGIPLTSLRQANNKWDNQILPGQKLILPGVIPTSSADSVIPYTNSELDLLARLIEAEAAGEIYEAKVAVGGVVINRVQSPEWPNNITNVINHISGGYYQFTPVKNGMISKPASSDSIKAAKAAIYGSDPSKGALFYFDDSSTNQWLWSKTRTAYIDHMVFVK
jgi:LysM repeat protein